MKNESKQDILNEIEIDLDGLTMADKKEMEKFAEDNDKEISYCYSVQDEGMCDSDIFAKTLIINPENSQHLMTAYIDKDDVDYEGARIKLVLTNQYYRYSGDIADKIFSALSDTNDNGDNELDHSLPIGKQENYCSIDEQEITKYNNAVADGNKYGDYSYITDNMSIATILEIIQNNANQAE